MIETRDLRKTFRSRSRGRVDALDGLTLTCERGQVYALLGPNGAGKTTALRILSTLMTPSGGDALIDGISVTAEPEAVRRKIGVVSYETRPYDRLTPRETATLFGRLSDMEEADIARMIGEISDLLEMKDFLDEPAEDLSTGMKQKTVLLRALVTNPTVLLFDEPSAGLDVLTAKRVTDYIRLLRDQGRTVLFSTHVLWEAERLADRIGIIHRGRLAEEGTLEDLRRRTGATDLEDIFFDRVMEG